VIYDLSNRGNLRDLDSASRSLLLQSASLENVMLRAQRYASAVFAVIRSPFVHFHKSVYH